MIFSGATDRNSKQKTLTKKAHQIGRPESLKRNTSRNQFPIYASHQISIFPARNAFDSINARRGSTSSPIKVVKI
jgi:hypothetical protein